MTLPLVIRALNERLRFRYWGPHRVARLDAFQVDLADWKLSLTDRTPCLWVHTPELLALPAVDLADELRDAIREQGWQNETVLVLVEGPAEALRRQLSESFTQFVVLDDKQQKEVFEAPSPTRLMLDTLLAQMSRARLAPYETSRPVTGSRFFGRQAHLKKILSHPKTNYLIIGIRRIGKSSLLREIERQLDLSDPPLDDQRRRLYLDCSVLATPEDFYREIVSRLSPRDLKLLLGRGSDSLRFQSRMFEYLADRHGGPITYLLDEIDQLLEALDADTRLFDVLRRASLQEGAARFIMAGFRQARRASSDRNSPFFNFAETLTLESLDLAEIRSMIEFPMEQLRIRLEGREGILQRIYRETAGLPNLVQFYCQTLLEALDRDEATVIAAESLQSVYENAGFRDFVIQTFMANALPLERAIVFSMVGTDRPQFTVKEIDAELNRHGLRVNFLHLDEACRNLAAADVLRQRGKQFGFTLPLFARMLQENYPVDYVLEKTLQEIDVRSLR